MVSGFALRFCKVALRAYRGEICPKSMDAIAIEVAWPRNHYQGC
jgi:hypothetical protein